MTIGIVIKTKIWSRWPKIKKPERKALRVLEKKSLVKEPTNVGPKSSYGCQFCDKLSPKSWQINELLRNRINKWNKKANFFTVFGLRIQVLLTTNVLSYISSLEFQFCLTSLYIYVQCETRLKDSLSKPITIFQGSLYFCVFGRWLRSILAHGIFFHLSYMHCPALPCAAVAFKQCSSDFLAFLWPLEAFIQEIKVTVEFCTLKLVK